MKRFTKFFLLMMTIVFSSSLLFAQFNPPLSITNEKAKAQSKVEVMKPQQKEVIKEVNPQRKPLNPGAQTQPMPEDRQLARSEGKTFTVPEDGDGSRAATEVYIELYVDYWYSEATYNLWSYSNGAYYWGWDQTFTYSYEYKGFYLMLTEGSTYSFECYDSFGDGGIEGYIYSSSYGWCTLASWGAYDYSTYLATDFIAGPCDPIPPNDLCANAQVVTGPYPKTISGTTVGATIDCPGFLDWKAVWYKIDLPNALNLVNINFCGTDGEIPTVGIIWYQNCGDCYAYTLFSEYDFYDCDDGNTNPILVAKNVPGPTTMYFPVYVGDGGMDFQYTVSVAGLGDLKGRVTNYYGLAVSGATISVEGWGISTTSIYDGSYLLTGVPSGLQKINCTRTGYNPASANVTIIQGGLVTKDFVLTQPNMVISPLSIEEVLNPGEYFTTTMDILNNGNGPLGWAAEIVYPEEDKAPAGYTVNPPDFMPPQGDPSGSASYLEFGPATGDGSRDLMVCPEESIFSIPPDSNPNIGYTSSAMAGYFCYQSFGGLTGTIDTVTYWGVFSSGTLPSAPQSFLITINEPGGSPGNVVTSVTTPVTAVYTGQMFSGYYQIGYFRVGIPSTAVTDGWLGVQCQSTSYYWYWLGTTNGAGFPAWQSGSTLPVRLAMCLGSAGAGAWLTMDSYEGNVPPFGGTAVIPTHLDASGTSAGEVYTADIIFTSDPDVSTITVPVKMIIYGPELVAPTDLTVTLLSDILGTVSVDWTWDGDAFLFFEIKRDGILIGTSTTTHFSDILPTYGVYCYTVQAVYDEGKTPPAGPECVEWPNPEISVTPMNLEGWVWPDNEVTVYTTIYNTGIGTLAYEFPDFVPKDAGSRASYCYAYGGDLNYISNVKMGDIDNSTGFSGYADYTGSESTDVEIGETYQLTVTDYYNYFPTDECGVWVDWNQDGDWSNDGDDIYVQGSPGVGPFTADITVPANALVGPTRMRIRSATWGDEALPCDYSNYGEVEDYTLNVTHHFISKVEPAMGKVLAGEFQQIAITYSADGFYPGNFYEDLILNSNDLDESELIIKNTMHVVAPGNFAGKVEDKDSGDGLPGVSVKAGSYQTTTDDNGLYSLYVNAGNYNVLFQKMGYISVTVLDTFALAGVVTPLDIKMWDANYPPGFVHAEVMENDTWCAVTWGIPAGPYEIVMDDGEADDYFIYQQAGSMNAVKFTPSGYPATAIGGEIYVGDGSFPGPFMGTQFGIALFDDDGPNGLPGTMLDSNGVTVNNYGWVSFDWLNATFEDGSFYLAMIQLAPSPFSAPIGVDLDDPTYYKSYSLYKGAPQWVLSPVQDFMIRAYVDGPQGDDKFAASTSKVLRATPKIPANINWQQYAMTQSGTLPKILPGYERNDASYKGVESMSNRDVTNYRIARYSNFDPDGSPAAGTLLELATTTNLFYNDIAWGGLAQGWYAYGVKALYTSGLYSDYQISNIVGHKMDFEVTVNVTLATGLEPINVEVTLQGLDFPYLNVFAVTPASGTVIFDPVWKGHYDITAFKIGYETYTIHNTSISADKTYDIILSEKRYPPTCLTVDPVSAIATWCEPLRTAVSQDFEDVTFPPAGWQKSSEADGPGWIRTDDGGSANFPIPSWDSFYACTNDDAAGTDSDGCCDYLITPAADLRESEGYAMSFDSYYDGAFGQLALVEYSVDGGATWEVLYQVMPDNDWTNLELDLSAFSGLAGPAKIWFAFHADDAGEWASGWAVDNVKIAVPAPAASWLDFWVFMDDTYKGVTTETTWNYAPLLYNHTYTASVAARYVSGLSSKDYYTFTSLYLFPPDSLMGIAPDDAAILEWWPPWELWPAMSPSGNGPKYSNEPFQLVAGPVADANAVNRLSAIDQVISTGSRDFGDVITSFPTGLGLGWGICDDGKNLWVTDYYAPSTLYEVDYEGNATGNTLECNEGQVWIGDMVSDGEFIYCVLVGGSNAIARVEIETGDVTTITGDFAGISQRGLGADFKNEEFYIGGWNEYIIYRTDFEGNTIDTYNGGAIAGLAWHPQGGPDGTGSLWCIVNATSDVCTEYDPNDGWATIQSFVIPDDSPGAGAGIEIRRSNPDAGALWMVNQYNQTIYLVDLDEPLSVGPVGGLPANLLGYNVYRDGDFVAYQAHTPVEEYVQQGYVDQGLQPGVYQYTVTAVYDLTPYGFDGQTGESMEEGPAEVVVDFCYELEFLETWSLGNFEDTKWLTDGTNWSINGNAGNPAPAAEFSWDPILTNYESSLTSYPLCAVGMTEGKIWFDFDVKLDAVQPTGEEMIHAQVWNWDTKTWNTVAEYSNVDGSFDWMSAHINIKGQAMDKVFRVRFQATGVNSINIEGWLVDNIHIYRACDGATELTAAASDIPHGILLNWSEPEGSNVDEWIHWDDGVNFDGIGTGGAAEFDVAHRWEPAQLVNYEGASVTQIAFFPREASATYRVRVWIGAGAANLVADQAVSPINNTWNTATLTTPVPIDITQELWVGYYVNTTTGYPAGVDEGPAIDGYGNMMNFGGWQTLLDINPDLDYNWNISAHVVTVAGVTMPLGKSTEPYNNAAGLTFVADPDPIQGNQVFDMVNGSRELSGYNIYRNEGGGEYALIDFTTENTYLDPADDLIAGTLYCYMVTAVWASETDMCESPFSNEACELWTSITDPNPNSGSFSLYPNPANDHVYITTSDDLKRVTVYNALGQLVMDEITTGKQYELKTASYTIGVYMVRVGTAAGVTTRTLTIQR